MAALWSQAIMAMCARVEGVRSLALAHLCEPKTKTVSPCVAEEATCARAHGAAVEAGVAGRCCCVCVEKGGEEGKGWAARERAASEGDASNLKDCAKMTRSVDLH
eukprot:6211098-Pleurochrysis_carterae.AAC.1